MQSACAILSSVAYPAAQYFSTLSHKWHHFKKNVTVNKLCFFSSYSCRILMELELSRQIFDKCSNSKFHENAFSGIGVLPCGQIDGRKKQRQTDRQT